MSSDVICVTMLERDGIYNAGDTYGFPPNVAAKLVGLRKAKLVDARDGALIQRHLPPHLRASPDVQKVVQVELPVVHDAPHEEPSADAAGSLFGKKRRK